MQRGGWHAAIGYFLKNKPVVLLLGLMLVAGGLYVAPFAWEGGGLPRSPIPVDAIPDVGENQQIIFTKWPGMSPRDIENQITYPLTTALLGMPGVRTVRSTSAFGFSTVYAIFNDDVEFYWARARVLEKLASLPPGTLPEGVTATLGPDATAMGQVFWYTLEGRDGAGNTVGGWDADELRSIQDWTVRYALQSAPGVSEVASIGGFVREYQVDVNPEALRAHGVSLAQVANAVRNSNLDVGARTLEVNRVEYLVRGLGFLKGVKDLEATVVVARQHTPIRLRDVGRVALGPALRRGALDDEGAPAVGGVVVARYRKNPLSVIAAVKEKIARIQPGLPKRTLQDGTVSQVTIVPFYDRTTLIHETLDTLSTALLLEILLALLVVLAMLRSLRGATLVSALLPLGVLGAFVAMKLTGVGANVMALAGIAIAIGTMVDIGIVFVENINRHLKDAKPSAGRTAPIQRAMAEVAPAVLTSVLTTMVSFLPVFGLSSSEFRLFAPLAFTKTFAMAAALLLALVLLPVLAFFVLRRSSPAAATATADEAARPPPPPPPPPPPARRRFLKPLRNGFVLLALTLLLAHLWLPLGPTRGLVFNAAFVGVLVAGVLGAFRFFEATYADVLRALLRRKRLFLLLPLSMCLFGATAWLGFHRVFAFLPESLRETRPLAAAAAAFPGLGREYMPPLDEGAYLYMPTTMAHASIGEVLSMLSAIDAAIARIPEVQRVVGKLGRVDSALDPAPLSMIETLISYKPEYRLGDDGRRIRQWRKHIRSPEDIWKEILQAAEYPGLTSAPTLMPMNARLVMLQSGMRAPMGIKIHGPTLQAIQAFGLRLEGILQRVPAIRTETVFADRVVGKPYIEIALNREAIGRYGLAISDVQHVLQLALGGMRLTQTVEGRARYPVRVRYMREERDSLEALQRIFVPTPHGASIPITQLADIHYVRGPSAIRAEDTFLTSYVLFDRQPDVAEVEAVQAAQSAIQAQLDSGKLALPTGVSFEFAGSYKNQLRSEKRLMLLIPAALALVFMLLYLKFRRSSTGLIVSMSVAVAASGGFMLVWLYGQPWFLNFEFLGTPLREVFRVGTVNMSVAVWIGFIALIGIATDDGVLLSSHLKRRFEAAPPTTAEEVRQRTIEAGSRRVRPCLMTTATTILALLPVITSKGRGADVMLPMALPSLGGMAIECITLFVVPVLYCALEEYKLRRARGTHHAERYHQ